MGRITTLIRKAFNRPAQAVALPLSQPDTTALFDGVMKMSLNEYLSSAATTISYGLGDNPSNATMLKNGHRGWVYGCVQAIADRTAGLGYRMVRRDVELDRHPFLDLIRQPNPLQGWHDLLHSTASILKLCGNHYWFVERSRANGKPVAIWPLTPESMSVLVLEETQPGGDGWRPQYLWNGQNILAENLLHIKLPNPANFWVGASPIEAAAYAHDASIYSQIYQKNFFLNNARPDFIVILPPNQVANEETAQRVWRLVADRHQGLEKAHKPLVVGNGTSIQPLQVSQADQKYLDAMNATRDLIHAIYCVPLAKRGLVADSNRANADAADYTFNRDCIEPFAQLLASAFTSLSQRLFRDDAVFEFDSCVEKDLEAERAQEAHDIEYGLCSRNEIRERRGLPPMEGGDVILIKTGLIPADLAGAAQQAAIDLRDAMAARPEPEPPEPEPEPEKHLVVEPNVKGLAIHGLWKMAGAHRTIPPEVHCEIWARYVKRMKPGEASYKRDVAEQFEREKTEILSRLPSVYERLSKSIDRSKDKRSIAKWLRKGVSDELIDWGAEIRQFKGIGQKHLFRSLLSEYNQVLDSLAVGQAPPADTLTDALNRWLDRRLAVYPAEICDTTREITDSIVRRMLAEGASVDRCAEAITLQYDGMETWRAQAIARTEMGSSMNIGAMEGYRDSQVVERKQWLAAIDERTRTWDNGDEFNHAIDEIQNLDDPFVGTGEALMFPMDSAGSPGNTINCRCTTVPVIEGE